MPEKRLGGFKVAIRSAERDVGELRTSCVAFVVRHVRRFLDCALHDMTRDKGDRPVLLSAPRDSQKHKEMKERQANAAQVYGRKRPASEQKIRTTGTEET
jgi:hypothetical protein